MSLAAKALISHRPVAWLCGLVALLACPRIAFAAAGPNGADGRLLSLEIKPATGEKFTLGKFDCWLPPGDQPLTAVIIHQHGCGAKSGTAAVAMARDAQWRALASHHRCALLVPRYDEAECANWNDPTRGSDRALATALQEFGTQSGHPELTTVPWLLWGHSGGASWSVQMIVRHPDRVVALALRGGASAQFGEAAFRAKFAAAARTLPMIFISGESERSPASSHHVSWEPFQTMARELRAAGGRVAWTVDPRTEHHCGDSRLLVIPYFDAVLTARVAGGKFAAVTVDEKSLTVTDAPGAWMPSRSVAEKWIEFVRTGTVTHVGPIERAPELRGTVSSGGRITLRWRLHPNLESGVRTVRIYRNGALLRELGVGPAEFIAEGGDTPPKELQVSEWIDRSAQPGLAYDYALSLTNCGGAESPRSATVPLAVPFPAPLKSR